MPVNMYMHVKPCPIVESTLQKVSSGTGTHIHNYSNTSMPTHSQLTSSRPIATCYRRTLHQNTMILPNPVDTTGIMTSLHWHHLCTECTRKITQHGRAATLPAIYNSTNLQYHNILQACPRVHKVHLSGAQPCACCFCQQKARHHFPGA